MPPMGCSSGTRSRPGTSAGPGLRAQAELIVEAAADDACSSLRRSPLCWMPIRSPLLWTQQRLRLAGAVSGLA